MSSDGAPSADPQGSLKPLTADVQGCGDCHPAHGVFCLGTSVFAYNTSRQLHWAPSCPFMCIGHYFKPQAAFLAQ